MFTVDYYELPDGKKPVEDFIDSLPLKMRTKAFYELALLEEYGNALREPYSKQIEDDCSNYVSSLQATSRESSISSW